MKWWNDADGGRSKVSNYFSKLTAIVNQMQNCGENTADQMVVEKVGFELGF
jgi:hypothetical protein